MKTNGCKRVMAAAAITGIPALGLNGCPQPEGGGTDTVTLGNDVVKFE